MKLLWPRFLVQKIIYLVTLGWNHNHSGVAVKFPLRVNMENAYPLAIRHIACLMTLDCANKNFIPVNMSVSGLSNDKMLRQKCI